MGHRLQLMVLFNLELAVKAGSKEYCSEQLMVSQWKAVVCRRENSICSSHGCCWPVLTPAALGSPARLLT